MKVGRGGTGLLLAQISDRVPVDGYTDSEETEKKIIRDAFKEGDAVFVTGSGLSETRDGGYGQYARIESQWAIPLPHGLTLRP